MENEESHAAPESASGGADSAEDAATVDEDLQGADDIGGDQDAEGTASAEQAEGSEERDQAEGDEDQGV
jgi:hypothetical protein